MWRIFAHLDLYAATFSALRAWIFFSNAARFAMDSPSPKGVCSLNVLRDLAGTVFAVETLKHCHRVWIVNIAQVFELVVHYIRLNFVTVAARRRVNAECQFRKAIRLSNDERPHH